LRLFFLARCSLSAFSLQFTFCSHLALVFLVLTGPTLKTYNYLAKFSTKTHCLPVYHLNHCASARKLWSILIHSRLWPVFICSGTLINPHLLRDSDQSSSAQGLWPIPICSGTLINPYPFKNCDRSPSTQHLQTLSTPVLSGPSSHICAILETLYVHKIQAECQLIFL
jgi:hypothetical protein